MTKDDTVSSEEWVIFPKQKHLIGLADNDKFSCCDILLNKGDFSSLSERALYLELPEGQSKIVAFEESLDILIAMVVIKLRQDGFRISESSKRRIQTMPQTNLQNVSSVLLLSSLSFKIRFDAAKLWFTTGILSDVAYLKSKQRVVEIFNGTTERPFSVPDTNYYVSSK